MQHDAITAIMQVAMTIKCGTCGHESSHLAIAEDFCDDVPDIIAVAVEDHVCPKCGATHDS